jgi:hypothetical protein
MQMRWLAAGKFVRKALRHVCRQPVRHEASPFPRAAPFPRVARVEHRQRRGLIEL